MVQSIDLTIQLSSPLLEQTSHPPTRNLVAIPLQTAILITPFGLSNDTDADDDDDDGADGDDDGGTTTPGDRPQGGAATAAAAADRRQPLRAVERGEGPRAAAAPRGEEKGGGRR